MYRAALAALLLLNLGLSGCAALPTGKPDPRDRFERFNRSIYKFNTAVDHAVLRPVARTYVKVLPQPVRTGIGNFTTNLAYPSTVANDFFQGKIGDGVSDAARIIINSTIGIGGLFDPASRMGLDRHTQDFGITLGKWGVHSGPYLMLPLLGASTVRDTVGLGPDYLLIYEIVSANLITNNYAIWGLYGLAQIDRRAGVLDLDRIVDSAYDPYAFVRSAYLQRRDYLIRGEENPEEMFPDADTDSSSDDKSAAPAQAPK